MDFCRCPVAILAWFSLLILGHRDVYNSGICILFRLSDTTLFSDLLSDLIHGNIYKILANGRYFHLLSSLGSPLSLISFSNPTISIDPFLKSSNINVVIHLLCVIHPTQIIDPSFNQNAIQTKLIKMSLLMPTHPLSTIGIMYQTFWKLQPSKIHGLNPRIRRSERMCPFYSITYAKLIPRTTNWTYCGAH